MSRCSISLPRLPQSPVKKSFDTLEDSRQYRNKPRRYDRVVEAFDTETERGNVRIIADSGDFVAVSSLAEIVKFMTRPALRSTLNVFWNLDYDVSSTMKFEYDLVRSIAKDGCGVWGNFYFKYLKGKEFVIRDKKKHSYRFYDIAQFYHTSLSNAVSIYLNEDVHELKGDRDRLFDLHSERVIGEYCMWDARHTKLLAEKFLHSLHSLQLFPRKLLSCGWISQQYVLNNCDIPRFCDIPYAVSKMYWDAYRGGWFDIMKRGVSKVRKYDLRSAYPHAMRDLPDLRDGVWKAVIDENATLGVLKAVVHPCTTDFHPIAGYGLGTMIYPFFDRDVIITLTLREFIYLKNHMCIEPLFGFSFYADKCGRKPYERAVDTLFSEKERCRSDKHLYNTTKKIINSLYGKTAEKKRTSEGWRVGQLFNPVYAAETTSRTRIKIYEACRKISQKVVMVMTDGVLLEKGSLLKTGSGLGDWTLEHDLGRCLAIHSGIYQFESERASTRGFSKDTDLWDLCAKGGDTLDVSRIRPRKLKECVAQNMLEKIGMFENVEKFLSPDKTMKRMWRPKCNDVSMLLERNYAGAAIPVSLIL